MFVLISPNKVVSKCCVGDDCRYLHFNSVNVRESTDTHDIHAKDDDNDDDDDEM